MMKYCPVTGICLKRFAIMVVAGFVFAFSYDWFVNVQLLMDKYLETPQLWRTEAEMQDKFILCLLYHFLIVWVSAFLFTRHYEGTGVQEGVRFGLMLGLILGIQMASSYIWMPISAELGLAWFAVNVLKGVGLGVIYALTYRHEKILVNKV